MSLSCPKFRLLNWSAGVMEYWSVGFRNHYSNTPSLHYSGSFTSSPFIHRHSLLVIAAHDAPVAVGLPADHDDVNLVGLEHFDHVVRRRFQFRRIRFFSESRSRVNIILNELVIPVFTGRHQRVLINPLDELFFGVEAAAVNKLPGCDGIE